MKKVILAVLSVAFVGAQMQGFAKTEGCDCKCQGHHAKHMDKLTQTLNLTEEQKAKMEEFKEKIRPQFEPVFIELRAEKTKLTEMRKNNAKPEELQKQKDKMKEVMLKVKKVHEDNLASFEQILTPEQKVKFEELRKQKMQEFKAKKARWDKANPEMNRQ